MRRQSTVVESPFIEQAYGHYTEENHEAWRRLYARMVPRWDRYANAHYLEGIHALCLDPDRIPRLEDVNRFLKPLTGFQAKAVSGYIPAFLFFDCLRNRAFPTTITIRPADKLDYLPEPDIFHDVAGHVPMHTDPALCRGSGAFRRVRAYRGRDCRQPSMTPTASPASSALWRASSGSPSNSV